MTFLAHRMEVIQSSPILAMNTRAAQMTAEGIDVIALSAGEPDFDTPDHIKQAAWQAMENGLTKYTPVDGFYSFKKAIQKKFMDDNSLTFELNELMVSTGGKQVLFNAFLATLNPGDEVIIPAPYWASYPDMVKVCGGKPVILPGNDSFKLTPMALRQAITARTKWLILNSPSNPTGAVYTSDELRQIADILKNFPHVWVMSDDIYEYLIYDNVSFTSILNVAPELKTRTLIANGASKSYSMTGWRVGYAAAPATLIKAMITLQSQSTTNTCSIAQKAAEAALTLPRTFLESWKEAFQRRRDFCVAALNQIPGLRCTSSPGAFYLYINCAGLIDKQTSEGKKLETDQDVAFFLLDHARVAVVHGEVFGLSPYFRISYATSDEKLSTACARIAEAVTTLKTIKEQ